MKRALLFGEHSFEDAALRRLVAPARDIEELGSVLSDSDVGGFTVEVCMDKTADLARRAITRFFNTAVADDILLFYVSTHGLKDESGNLYFAARDTTLGEIEASTIEASLIHGLSRKSRARQQILILDTCFSGAFGKDWSAKDAAGLSREDIVGTAPSVQDGSPSSLHFPRGLSVLTASTSFQYSFEAKDGLHKQPASVFTKFLVEGIRSGEADSDGDGDISEEELYNYVASRTRAERPTQTPQRWVIGSNSKIVIAHTSHLKAAPLPRHVTALLEDPIAHVRVAGVELLAEMASGNHKGLALAATDRLLQLSQTDDSNRVRSVCLLKLGNSGSLPQSFPPSSRIERPPQQPVLRSLPRELVADIEIAASVSTTQPQAVYIYQTTEPSSSSNSGKARNPAALIPRVAAAVAFIVIGGSIWGYMTSVRQDPTRPENKRNVMCSIERSDCIHSCGEEPAAHLQTHEVWSKCGAKCWHMQVACQQVQP